MKRENRLDLLREKCRFLKNIHQNWVGSVIKTIQENGLERLPGTYGAPVHHPFRVVVKNKKIKHRNPVLTGSRFGNHHIRQHRELINQFTAAIGTVKGALGNLRLLLDLDFKSVL